MPHLFVTVSQVKLGQVGTCLMLMAGFCMYNAKGWDDSREEYMTDADCVLSIFLALFAVAVYDLHFAEAL